VLKPADDFVRDLVGADDVLRRLSLIPIQTVIRPLNGASESTVIENNCSLRDALSLLLERNEPSARVVDSDGNPVGAVDLHTIQAASVEGWLPATSERT
jgi:osmoprotectant transport system ATP-binding protein